MNKLEELILYIMKKCPNLTENELNQILFLIDMTSYKLTGKSITGSEYINAA